jgi:hypothetical protein
MKHSEQHIADFFLTSIYKKAWKDKSFLKKLVKNPMETLDDFTGKKGKLPNGKSIVVEDQTNPNHVYLNIPPKPANYIDIELNEAQLDHVTGASGNSLNNAFLNLKTELKNLFGN